MEIQDIKNDGFFVAIGLFFAEVIEHFIKHPSAAIGSFIMILIAWERFKKIRAERKEQEARARKSKIDEQRAKESLDDWKNRLKIQMEEEKNIGREED